MCFLHRRYVRYGSEVIHAAVPSLLPFSSFSGPSCIKKRKKGSDMFYIYLPDKQGGIPITADRLLRSIGASGRYTGFDYAVYMIEQVVSSQESIHLITKRLYPETARHFGVKPHSVEHALRTLINTCWDYGDRDAMNEIAGRPLIQAPSNAEFIDMMAAYIKGMN